MMRKLMKKRLNSKGFTLVELVVVIAILGILAAIAVPRLLGFTERARAQADRQLAVQVRNAMALLYANGEATPGTVILDADTDKFTYGGTGITDTVMEDLIGTTHDVQGDVDIKITLGTDGSVTVNSPTGITAGSDAGSGSGSGS